uniref:Uncharacterized protein n=1 Tax=Panagrolaimus sp. JU765 TaxID=591449 RepID=A0AC34QBP4_9BILA
MNSPFRGLKRTGSGNGGNSYPYPRSHSTVMVLPSARSSNSKNGDWSSASSLADDSPTSSLSTLNFDASNTGPSYGFERRRPPLNRAIPPIPESKSNESIMSQLSKSVAGTPMEPKQPLLELVEEVPEDKSVVIENKMAQNLAVKSASETLPTKSNKTNSISNNCTNNIPSKLKQPKIYEKHTTNFSKAEPPKSPLLSMAHSVRNRLTKLGTRFGRVDAHQSPIKSSTSLISMNKPPPVPIQKMAKSSSMETASTSSSEKKIPQLRSQITLIPSPSRSPRPLILDSPEETSRGFLKPVDEEPMNVDSTTTTAPKTTETNDPTLNVTASPTSSNTDTIYSGRASSSVKQMTSPDWSDNCEMTKSAVTTTAQCVPQVNEKKEPTVDIKNIAKLEKTKVELNTTPSKFGSSKSGKKDNAEKQKTPKLSSKFSIGLCHNSKSAKMSLPSPKIKIKTSLSLKKSLESLEQTKRSSTIGNLQRKTDPPKRRSTIDTEMKFIKKIEKSLVPLMPHSNSKIKVDDNKNLDLRNIHVKSVNMKHKRAPLAECESTRVENSPAVELPPIGFDRLTSSPGARRRIQTTIFNRTVPAFGQDANGNLILNDKSKVQNGDIPKSVEINLNEKRKFEPSIELPTPYDNMVNEESVHENHTDIMNGNFVENTTIIRKKDGFIFEQIESRICTLKEEMETTDNQTKGDVEELSHENEILRQQLLERDRIIEALRAQLALMPNKE